MSGLVSYSTILADSLNPGTILCGACPSMPMPFIAGKYKQCYKYIL